MRGYQTLQDAADLVSGAMTLIDDPNVSAICKSASLIDGFRMTRVEFERQAIRFDNAFDGLMLSGYVATGE
jgi:hypothetical protein